MYVNMSICVCMCHVGVLCVHVSICVCTYCVGVHAHVHVKVCPVWVCDHLGTWEPSFRSSHHWEWPEYQKQTKNREKN